MTRLVWFETHGHIHEAIAREKHIKAWKRQWKIDLFRDTNPNWDDLYPALMSTMLHASWGELAGHANSSYPSALKYCAGRVLNALQVVSAPVTIVSTTEPARTPRISTGSTPKPTSMPASLMIA